ncbi:MAG: hypothetical protein IMW89_06250 [Ktedonobacteraceae bacterium]|nr:hypothetical protein [Ktedonobacteraceae bacterium]
MPASYFSDENGQYASDAPSPAPLRALRRFTRERRRAQETVREAQRPVAEHCELCGDLLPTEHQHMLALASHSIVCACNACSLLMGRDGAAEGKYRLIPQRYLLLPDFRLSDEQWTGLMIPVNMVYVFHSSATGQAMAFYPGPAGATEALLDPQQWETIAGNNPVLQQMEPDVEALLINRLEGAHEYYIVPIDACYQLVGLLRLSWRGFSGGEEARLTLARFFADLWAKSRPVKGEPDA